MKQTFVILGPWELRHQEAASLGRPQATWAPLKDIDTTMRTIVIPKGDLGSVGPLDAEEMPLAIARRDGQGDVVLSHLLHVLDTDCAMFFQVDRAVPDGVTIEAAIAQAFDEWYLPLSNNECFYTYTSTKQRKFPAPGSVQMSAVARYFSQDLSSGRIAPFVPRFRFPVRGSFDVATEFSFTEATQAREFAVLYGPPIETDDPSERARPCSLVHTVQRGDAEQVERHTVTLGSEDATELVAATLGRACKLRRVWRRVTVDVPVESARSGAIFMVTFEHRTFPDSPAEGSVTVTYEKTRGPFDAGVTALELDRLTEAVKKILVQMQKAQEPSAQDHPASNTEVIA